MPPASPHDEAADARVTGGAVGPELLCAQGLLRSYGRGGLEVRAVDDLSLAVGEGEFLAVTGPSGSGKTTLLSLLAGLDRPTAGSVCFRGVDYADLDEAGLARLRQERMGLVFQDGCLVEALTALDNVRLPLLFGGRLADSQRAVEWLERLGLGARLHSLPQELSAGEAQRVGIARALVSGPELLIADEPTGHLDQTASRDVFELLRELCRAEGVTTIVVTHNLLIEEFADRCLGLSDGRVAGERRRES